MERQVILTADGSHSVSIPELNVTYHSVHGAAQESMHVFIEAGLRYWSGRSNHPDQCNILEMGFGTGLNAFMTFAEVAQKEISIHYTSIELFPLSKEEYQLLNYPEALNENEKKSAFENMHNSEWEKDVLISSQFTLFKTNQSLLGFTSERLFDIVYFDAFAPTAQPELWTVDVFTSLYNMLGQSAVLVTYCSKGDVRRAMQAAGFSVEKIPGPPRKREMLRAIKQ